MELGILLPHAGMAADPASIREVAQASERLGLASVWAGDHILLPQEQRSHYPYAEEPQYPVPAERNFLEPFTTLAFAACATERVRLGVSVCVVPYRHPLALAKVVATLDFLSFGRAVLGIGEGWLAEEFAALGVPFEERAARTDEALALLQGAWFQDGAFSFQGRFYRCEGVLVRPQPVQRPLPLWVGGNGRRARERAARYGTAWHPTIWHLCPADLARRYREVQELAERAGRDPASVGLTLFAPAEVAEEPPGRPPWETGGIVGPPAYIATVLRQYEEAGVEHVVLALGRSGRRRIENMAAIAEELRRV